MGKHNFRLLLVLIGIHKNMITNLFNYPNYTLIYVVQALTLLNRKHLTGLTNTLFYGII